MRWGKGIFWLAMAFAGASSGEAAPGYSVEIDLEQQTAYLIRGRRIVLASPISSGRAGHFTETGSFKITEKERKHFSSLYGKIVDARGRTVVADADADMRVPRGGKFIPAPMSYFMRFDGATGMHAGYLPGYPASHGCVRLPERNAIAFFNAVEIGTPVHVFGRTPRTREYFRYGPQPTRPLPQRPARPRFDPRATPPALERPPPNSDDDY
jgi:lipoprotein-anchoring transpeptidase ErfK/SrfK